MLNVGKQFRNVGGSTSHGTIGSGDLLPDKYYSWTKVYEKIAKTDLGTSFTCPACTTVTQTINGVGGHIVLGPNSYPGRADANIDLRGAGDIFRPYCKMKDVRNGIWETYYMRRALLPNVNRVFLVPLCKDCNNQGSGVDLTIQINVKIAQLICYGYTDNFEVYSRFYETPFFTINEEIDDCKDNHNKLYYEMKSYFASVVSGWINSIRAIDPTDQTYINSAVSAQPSVPSIISS
jgi:transcription elongation factor Elf1